MSPVPASAITIADGEITIDAELLAPAGQHRSPKSARPRQDRITSTTFSLPTADASQQYYASVDFKGDGVNDIAWLRPNGILTS